MRFRSQKYRRFFGKTMVFSAFMLFLAIGVALGYYYDEERTGSVPFSSAFKSMFFYGGELTALSGVTEHLPVFSETERMSDASLTAWEVTYYRDERTGTDVPVFYGETAGENGVKAAMGTALIRVSSAREVPVEALEPEKMSVLIYCTHTSESYDGEADENGRGQVLSAAHHLADTLTSLYGVGAVVSDTVHDSPDWYKSYTNSKATAAELISQYPDADLIIDFHRDSGVSKEDCTVSVDGKNAATLLLVVGSDVTLEHPNWEQNWETAKALGEAIDGVDPSLLRGIRVQKGRYNQHLSTNCVLLEVGTDLNTAAEAEYSTELVAKAIAEYLQKKE